jgi:LAS superfamily LD-carboxypeptidase LdcB
LGAEYPDIKESLDTQAKTQAVAGVPSDIANYALDKYKSDKNLNGKLDTAKLSLLDTRRVTVSGAEFPYLYPAAAEKLYSLVDAAKKAGYSITVSSAYRTLEKQQELAASLPKGKAALPGHSNHGWGIAVDILELYRAAGNGTTSPAVNKQVRGTNALYKWLDQNAIKYGFLNPDSLRDGGATDEAWHWEYHP